MAVYEDMCERRRFFLLLEHQVRYVGCARICDARWVSEYHAYVGWQYMRMCVKDEGLVDFVGIKSGM